MEVQESDVSMETASTAAVEKCLHFLTSDFLLKSKGNRVKHTVLLTQDAADDGDLSTYRLGLIAKITANIYKQAGWTVVNKENASLDINWHLTLSSLRPNHTGQSISLQSQSVQVPCIVDGKTTYVTVNSIKGPRPDQSDTPAMRIVCGVVRNKETKQRERNITMQDYISLREKDLRECESSAALVEATVKLEMLHVRSASCVTLDFSPGTLANRGASNKGAAFFMYNYARLATLLQRHADLVTKGQYPELPPVDSIAAALIANSQAESSLMCSCLESYSALLSDFESAIRKGHYPEPHKLCRFLAEMCQPLSKYYRTHHVLTEPRENLLPLMHARLHLLSAVLRVMDRVFALLEIVPPQHMWSWNPENPDDDISKRGVKRKHTGDPTTTMLLQHLHL